MEGIFSILLVELKDLWKLREIPATVFGDQHHIFNSDRAKARVIQAGFHGHDMSFLQQRTRSADARRFVNIQSDPMPRPVKIPLHTAIDHSRPIPGRFESVSRCLDGSLRRRPHRGFS